MKRPQDASRSFDTVAFVAVTLCSLFLLVRAGGEQTIDFPWCVPPDDAEFETHYAKVGDTVAFEWKESAVYHDVNVVPTNEGCSATSVELVGSATGASYTFAEKDMGNVTFACSVGDHCVQGQIVTFEVVSAADENVDYADAASNPCVGHFDGDDHDHDHNGDDHDHGDDHPLAGVGHLLEDLFLMLLRLLSSLGIVRLDFA